MAKKAMLNMVLRDNEELISEYSNPGIQQALESDQRTVELNCGSCDLAIANDGECNYGFDDLHIYRIGDSFYTLIESYAALNKIPEKIKCPSKLKSLILIGPANGGTDRDEDTLKGLLSFEYLISDTSEEFPLGKRAELSG